MMRERQFHLADSTTRSKSCPQTKDSSKLLGVTISRRRKNRSYTVYADEVLRYHLKHREGGKGWNSLKDTKGQPPGMQSNNMLQRLSFE